MNAPVIPIVFATNDNFTLFCYIAIDSLIRHTSESNRYEIYILETELSEENQRLLTGLGKENVSVSCVDISNLTGNVELKSSLHLSQETYYRLFIPLIFPQYEKIMYLDADMCILEDVAKLYEVNIGNYSVGAVPDVVCYTLQAHTETLGCSDVRKTFNAGVLLINTAQFEKQKIREKCLALLQEDYRREKRILIFADQDALNIVLYENFYVLDGKWNYQPQYLPRTEDLMDDMREKYIHDQYGAAVLHYSGDRKPWKNPDLPQADNFWKCVKEAGVMEKLVTQLMIDVRNTEESLKCFEIFRFPYGQIPYESKVAIYAAGRVGKAFYYQLKASKYAQVVLWVDRDWEKQDTSLGVSRVEELFHADFDYVLISMENAKIAEDVKKMLVDRGISERKIIWDEYRI